EDAVVIECDFGKITVNRAQIASIKRWRRPSAYEKKPTDSGRSLGPPAGAVPVPKTEAYFLPPGAPWFKSAEGRDGEVVYRFGQVGVLAVRAFDTPGGSRGAFMDFAKSYTKQFLSSSVILGREIYMHGGRNAFEVAHEDPKAKGALTREYLVDLGEKKILVRLVVEQGRLGECVAGYLRVRNSLTVPEVRSGKRYLARPVRVRTPFVNIAYDPPPGPWKVKNKRHEYIQATGFYRDKEGMVVVLVGFWDGNGKLVIHVFNDAIRKFKDMDVEGLALTNERTHDMGRRVEHTADIQAKVSGSLYKGKQFILHQDLCFVAVSCLASVGNEHAIEGVMTAVKKSIRVEKDWTEALKDEHWQTCTTQGTGIQFKVPKWWEGG
ncbi:MAG: hypothetical protein ACYS47_21545, partial [Planctomycetota bacterium]